MTDKQDISIFQYNNARIKINTALNIFVYPKNFRVNKYKQENYQPLFCSSLTSLFISIIR